MTHLRSGAALPSPNRHSDTVPPKGTGSSAGFLDASPCRPNSGRMDHDKLLAALAGTMRSAGTLIEEVRALGVVGRKKADASLVTEADERAELLLESAILALEPDAVIVGEEAVAAGRIPEAACRFWLLDPLDGTKDFVSGGTDYTVNAGLIVDGVPVLGLVLHPPTMRLWAGAAGAAWREDGVGSRVPITARPLPAQPAIVTSHSHLDDRTRAWATAVTAGVARPAGSSLKFCLLAEGSADIYPRFGPTSEWDTAAADAVLRAAGGMTLDGDGRPFRYGKPNYLNGAFLALGDPSALDRLPPFRA